MSSKNPSSRSAVLKFIAIAVLAFSCTNEKLSMVSLSEDEDTINREERLRLASINNSPTCQGLEDPFEITSSEIDGTMLKFNLKDLRLGRDSDGSVLSFQFHTDSSDYLSLINSFPCESAPCTWGQEILVPQKRSAGSYLLNYTVSDDNSPPGVSELCYLKILVGDASSNQPPVLSDLELRVAPGQTIQLPKFLVMDPEGNRIDLVRIDNPSVEENRGSFSCENADCPFSSTINYSAPMVATINGNITYEFSFKVQDAGGLWSNTATIRVIIDAECGAGLLAAETYDYEIGKANKDANIVFAISTSGSMGNEIPKIIRNMNEFGLNHKNRFDSERTKFVIMGTNRNGTDILSNTIFEKDGQKNGVYWHYKKIDAMDKLQNLLKMYHIGQVKDLFGINQTLNSPSDVELPGYSSMGPCDRSGNLYNCDAFNHLIVITDSKEQLNFTNGGTSDQQEIEDIFIRDFRANVSTLGNSMRFHGLVSKSSNGCGSTTQLSSPIYNNLSSRTGGLALDVCLDDWTPLFEQLESNILQSVAAKDLNVCSEQDRTISRVTVSWPRDINNPGAGKDSIILSPGDYIYTPPKGSTKPSIYIDSKLLASKGVPTASGTILTVKVEFLLK